MWHIISMGNRMIKYVSVRLSAMIAIMCLCGVDRQNCARNTEMCFFFSYTLVCQTVDHYYIILDGWKENSRML